MSALERQSWVRRGKLYLDHMAGGVGRALPERTWTLLQEEKMVGKYKEMCPTVGEPKVKTSAII